MHRYEPDFLYLVVTLHHEVLYIGHPSMSNDYVSKGASIQHPMSSPCWVHRGGDPTVQSVIEIATGIGDEFRAQGARWMNCSGLQLVEGVTAHMRIDPNGIAKLYETWLPMAEWIHTERHRLDIAHAGASGISKRDS